RSLFHPTYLNFDTYTISLHEDLPIFYINPVLILTLRIFIHQEKRIVVVFSIVILKLSQPLQSRLPIITQTVYVYLPRHPCEEVHDGISAITIVGTVGTGLFHVIDIERRAKLIGELIRRTYIDLVPIQVVVGDHPHFV